MSAFLAKHCLCWGTYCSPLISAGHVIGQLLEKNLRPRITARQRICIFCSKPSVQPCFFSVAWIVGAAHVCASLHLVRSFLTPGLRKLASVPLILRIFSNQRLHVIPLKQHQQPVILSVGKVCGFSSKADRTRRRADPIFFSELPTPFFPSFT